MKYDVAVIGAGPAGMMAAGKAGELGAAVILIEKNPSLGIKLLMSGNGRCNITNKTNNPREMIDKFGKNGKFLFSAFAKFGVNEVINFFESRGVKTKVEKENCVFTASDKARDVLNALLDYLRESKVEVRTNTAVSKIVAKNNRIEKIILANGQEIVADKFIVCTGGKSYPQTGSTGDGYIWLEQLGHTITPLSPVLTPVVVKEPWVKELEGVSLRDVGISVYKDNKKVDSRTGDAIFTDNGMSGPIVILLSKNINESLDGSVKLLIDFKPERDLAQMDKLLQTNFQNNGNKLIKNSLNDLIPAKLVSIVLKLAQIEPEKKVNIISKEERKKILHLLKEFTLEVKELGGFNKAIVTAGGVGLKEVDSKTMKSKHYCNLYLAGELLDIDGPTGGYNLQACWSTGYVAGESAVNNNASSD